MVYETFYSDLICIGAGLAGERIAIEAAIAGFKTIILSLVPPRRSHSCAAEGGMQAALGNCAMGKDDNPDLHFADTVKGSDWGCDQEVARIFVDTAPTAIREASYWGMPWNRVEAGKSTYFKGGTCFEVEDKASKHGLITARAFGGTAKWRTCYTADGTGHALLYTLDNKVAELGITVHDRVEAISLIHDGEKCIGCIVRCLKTGKLQVYLAKATLIATGGYGKLYNESTNTVINEGGGHIIALNTGLVPLGNPEAVQFHPTGIIPSNILVTEGCRGDGGTLLDVDQKRFMHIYEPEKAELASRDVVSRWMIYHIREGKGVPSPYGTHLWLDIRHLGKKHIISRLREVYDTCMYFLGIDPTTQLIPVRPCQHYSMGGIRTDKNGNVYGLKGLFSAGEACCWDMHGFNRLGGNSLAETIVAGRHIGQAVTKYIQGTETTLRTNLARQIIINDQKRIDRLIRGANGKENVYDIRNTMQQIMTKHVGIFRHQKGLKKAIEELHELLIRSKKIRLRSSGIGACPELALAIKISSMIRIATCVAYSALQRTESRGAHARDDYTARNDRDWLNRTLAYWHINKDIPTIKYEPASPVFYLPPGNRGYGKSKIVHQKKTKTNESA